MSENDKKNAKFFRAAGGSSEDILEQLKKACRGLVLISETDADVVPFAGPKLAAGDAPDAASIREFAKIDDNEPVEIISLGRFFSKLTTTRDWHGTREKERTKKFLDLQKLIEERLNGAKVFRFGRVRIKIFIVGLAPDRRVLGASTEATET